jgi:hypothetical protein
LDPTTARRNHEAVLGVCERAVEDRGCLLVPPSLTHEQRPSVVTTASGPNIVGGC